MSRKLDVVTLDGEEYDALIEKAQLYEEACALDPIYLYRRRGHSAFATCTHERFEELSEKGIFECMEIQPLTAPLFCVAKGEDQ